MTEITFIVPIHTYNADVKKLLDKSLKSIKNIKNLKDYYIIISGPNDVIEQVKLDNKTNKKLSFVECEDTNPFTLINTGVKKCLTKYFSIFEFDDLFEDNWFINFDKFSKEYDDPSILIPIDESIDTSGNPIGFINEYAWSTTFSEDFGNVTLESLETYFDYNITGAAIKTDDFISIGMLKPSLKIAAWYEMLLRMVYNQKEVRVLPRITYQHMLGRKSSYGEVCYSVISKEEGAWLIDTAKQEYFFKEDRNKTFKED